MLPALPTGRATACGTSPSASAISNAAVFCPSIRCGLTLFKSAMPVRCAISRTRDSAASKFPRSTTMRAPCATAWASLPRATFPSGTTTLQRTPAAAQYAAALAEVLPVEAQTALCAPASTAFATATTIPRSLKEPVGFCPSNFSQSSAHPMSRARVGAAISGVSPSPSVRCGVRGVSGRWAAQRARTPRFTSGPRRGSAPAPPAWTKASRAAPRRWPAPPPAPRR